MSDADFDPHAARYAEQLAQGLKLSGECSDYFLQQRIARTRALLGFAPHSILDFGCGVGDAAPVLKASFPHARITGVDVSTASLALAAQRHGGFAAFVQPHELPASGFDFAYGNGVFHHIPLAERSTAMRQLASALAPGGVLAFWENNPWSLPARWVMSRIPFDRDAVMVWPSGAKQLLRDAGLEVERREFHFIWPRSLAWLRFTERWLRSVPAGAQYLIVARKTAVP